MRVALAVAVVAIVIAAVRYGDRIADKWHEWEWRLRGSNLEDRLLGLALFGLCLAWIVAMTRVAQRSRRE